VSVVDGVSAIADWNGQHLTVAASVAQADVTAGTVVVPLAPIEERAGAEAAQLAAGVGSGAVSGLLLAEALLAPPVAPGVRPVERFVATYAGLLNTVAPRGGRCGGGIQRGGRMGTGRIPGVATAGVRGDPGGVAGAGGADGRALRQGWLESAGRCPRGADRLHCTHHC
jgi:hypothetical protein